MKQQATRKPGPKYPPAPSDTVPAMLTPGERVMNVEASRKHGKALDRMNRDGLKERAGRGGVMARAGGYNCGGKVRGYGDGGVVRGVMDAVGRATHGLIGPSENQQAVRDRTRALRAGTATDLPAAPAMAAPAVPAAAPQAPALTGVMGAAGALRDRGQVIDQAVGYANGGVVEEDPLDAWVKQNFPSPSDTNVEVKPRVVPDRPVSERVRRPAANPFAGGAETLDNVVGNVFPLPSDTNVEVKPRVVPDRPVSERVRANRGPGIGARVADVASGVRAALNNPQPLQGFEGVSGQGMMNNGRPVVNYDKTVDMASRVADGVNAVRQALPEPKPIGRTDVAAAGPSDADYGRAVSAMADRFTDAYDRSGLLDAAGQFGREVVGGLSGIAEPVARVVAGPDRAKALAKAFSGDTAPSTLTAPTPKPVAAPPSTGRVAKPPAQPSAAEVAAMAPRGGEARDSKIGIEYRVGPGGAVAKRILGQDVPMGGSFTVAGGGRVMHDDGSYSYSSADGRGTFTRNAKGELIDYASPTTQAADTAARGAGFADRRDYLSAKAEAEAERAQNLALAVPAAPTVKADTQPWDDRIKAVGSPTTVRGMRELAALLAGRQNAINQANEANAAAYGHQVSGTAALWRAALDAQQGAASNRLAEARLGLDQQKEGREARQGGVKARIEAVQADLIDKILSGTPEEQAAAQKQWDALFRKGGGSSGRSRVVNLPTDNLGGTQPAMLVPGTTEAVPITLRQQAPASALEYLRKNPGQIEAFVQKYGYRPAGF